MVRDKNIGYCRVLKGGRIAIPKEVRYKLSIKDGDFVDFSQIWIYLNNQIQIDQKKAMKQIDSLRKRKLLLS